MTDRSLVPQNPDPELLTSQHRRNALWISSLTGAILVAITIYIIVVTVRDNRSDYVNGILTSILTLLAFISFAISRRGRTTLGMGILVSGMTLSLLLLPYLTPGEVIAPAIAGAMMVTTISMATLPSRWALRASIAAIVVGLLAVIADLFLPVGFGAQGEQTGNIPVSVGLAIVYAFFILRGYSSFNLRTKILTAFIIIALVPLASLGTYNSTIARQTLEKQGQQNLTQLAETVAERTDAYINTQLDNIRTEAQLPPIVSYMDLPSFARSGSPEEASALRTLNAYVRKDALFVYSYALLDNNGKDILDTVEEQIGRNESQFDYFKQPFTDNLPYASTLFFEKNKAIIHFSAPIRNQAGDTIGILRADYNAAALQSLVHSLLVGHENQGQLLALVDAETYVRVAYTGNRTELYKSFFNYGPTSAAALQTQGRLLPGDSVDALAISSSIVDGLKNLGTSTYFSTHSPSVGDTTLTTGVPLTSVKWIAMSSQSERILFTPVRDQNRTTILIAIGLIMLAILAALGAAQLISAPVQTLTTTAEKIAAGELTTRATVLTKDEIGNLASAFNRMADQLNQTLSGLETRVLERTSELESARLQSEERAQDLQIISDVARVVSAEQKLDVLLPLITNLVSEKFNYYHTGIFLLDPNRQFAVLQAANSTGGKRMLERGHRLEVGQIGIVGYVSQTGQPRIALDVGADAVFFNNPDLPNTRSEMALPLNVRGQTIGVLDVQSTESGAFTNSDINTLSILADQVAIAIENARLFGQTEAALAEVQSIYRQYISQEWRSFARQNQHFGYQQSLAGGRRLMGEAQSPEIHSALEKGEVTVRPASDNEEAALVMPVKLRGQVIGVVNIKSSQKEHTWSEEEIGMVQAVSDRLALALENARLFEETSRRAERERKVSEITSHIRSTNDPNEMVRLAIQELKDALGVSRVEVLPQKVSDPSGSQS